MTHAIDDFIAEAQQVTIADAAVRLGLKFTGKRHEHAGPCPVDGGRDCFSFNTEKNAWNCRAAGVGGRDAIGLAAHVLELDMKRRSGFLEACAEVTGREIPTGGERESDEDRAARRARLDAKRLEHYEQMAAQQAGRNEFRDRERAKARGILDAAVRISHDIARPARLYVNGRTGADPFDVAQWLRFAPAQPYWHGQDETGRPAELHNGPALVAPIVDASLDIIGCHITWIAIGVLPKHRPRLVDPHSGATLPTKKMRGSKKGGLIPLVGDPDARRWVGGEGIENGLAFGQWEGFRSDTFYFAAGDLGNLSGPSADRFPHPTATRTDRRGRVMPVMVPGPTPKAIGPDDAMWVAAHVDELVLLGDGDSETVFTAAAMARARARHARPGRLIPIVWPKGRTDFAALSRSLEDA